MLKIASAICQQFLTRSNGQDVFKNTKLLEVQALVNLTKQICNSGYQPSIYMSALELRLEVCDGKQQKKG